MKSTRFAVASLIAATFAVAAPVAAETPRAHDAIRADSSTSTPTEVMVMHATQTASPSIDPRIGNLPQLTKPPFASFNTYKLLDRKNLSVEHGKPSLVALPNGRSLQVSVEPAGNKLYKVTASISKDQGGGSYLKLLEITAPKGEPFFVAGQSYDGGKLVLAITIK